MANVQDRPKQKYTFHELIEMLKGEYNSLALQIPAKDEPADMGLVVISEEVKIGDWFGQHRGEQGDELPMLDAPTQKTIFDTDAESKEKFVGKKPSDTDAETTSSPRHGVLRECRAKDDFSMSVLWKGGSDKTLIDQIATEMNERTTNAIAKLEKIENRSRFIILPTSARRLAWDLVGLCFIAYESVYIPLLAFDLPPLVLLMVLDWIILCFWTLDMVQSCFLSYYEQGDLVVEHSKILRHYLRTWFLLDIIVVVPDWLVLFLDAGGAGDLTGLGRIFRVARAVRVFRWLRILKLRRLIMTIYDMIDSEYTMIFVDLVRLLVCVLFLNHVIACVFFWIGRNSCGLDRCWLRDSGQDPVHNAGLGWQYATALHWSMTQFTPASMDVTATNVPERWFSIITLFFAMVTFGTIIGNITRSMTALKDLKGDSVKQFWLLRRFLRQEKIASELKDRIIKFLEHQDDRTRCKINSSGIKILSLLSKPLRDEMTHGMYIAHLRAHPFFYYIAEIMPYVAFKICTEAINVSMYAVDDVVFYTGIAATHMYFIKSGDFNYRIEDRRSFMKGVPVELWVSEPVLWVKWNHRGKLDSKSPGDMLTCTPAGLSNAINIHPRPQVFAGNYASIFTSLMNEGAPTDLSRFNHFHSVNFGYSANVAACDDWHDS